MEGISYIRNYLEFDHQDQVVLISKGLEVILVNTKRGIELGKGTYC